MFKEKVALYLKQKPFQGTVLIEKNNEVIIKQAYGYANVKEKIPNKTDTFTEDAFHLRISKNISRETLLKAISKDELEFEPGTEYSYSNTNYYFRGMIIEKVSKMSYQKYVTKNILEPLGMTSTSFDPRNTTATGYGQNKGEYSPIMSLNPTISYAAASICSNVDDMLLWENAVMAGKLLLSQSWSEIFDGGDFGYGFGWGIKGIMYNHNGNTPGFNSYVIISPKCNFVIILLANTRQYSTLEIGDNITQKFYKNLIIK